MKIWMFFCVIIYAVVLFGKGDYTAFIPEFKINPVSGKFVNSGEKISAFQTQYNLINTSGEINMSAAADETVMLQLLTPPDFKLQFALENTAGVRFALYQAGMVRSPESEKEALPDILLPLKNVEGKFVARSAGELIPAESQYLLFWLEFTPEKTLLGELKEMSFQIISGEKTEAISIRLKVYDNELPAANLAIDFNEYGDKYLQIYRDDYSEETLWKIEEAVFQEGFSLGGSINPLPYKSQKGSARNGMAPVLKNDDLLNPELDWEAFDARFGKYLGGSAFPDGKPIDHLYLPFNPYWPASFKLYLSDRTQYEKIWAAFAKEYIRHFKEKGWTETTFQIYCNQKPNKGGGVLWHLDEPKSVDDYQALRYYADLAKRAFDNEDSLKFKFRIDISHFYCDKHRGNNKKDFRVNGGADILAPVDIWVISRHSLYDETAIREAKKLMEKGKEVWIYAETPKIKEAGSQAIRRVHNAWMQGYDGLLIWRSFARKLHKRKGSEFILYAVEIDGEKGIYPSIRAKLMKRGIEDSRLFDLAIQKGEVTRAEVTEMIKKYGYSAQEALWEYRTRLHENLLGYQKIGSTAEALDNAKLGK